MGAPIAPKWIKSASSVANAKTLENTADGGYQEVDALSADVKAALTGASNPGAANPFATVAEAGGEDDKTVKSSSSDTTPGFLDAKVDNATIEVAENKLRLKSGGHSHAQSEISGLVDALAAKAGTAVATTSANGLMSSTDKTRLDGIDAAQLTEDDVVALIITLS